MYPYNNTPDAMNPNVPMDAGDGAGVNFGVGVGGGGNVSAGGGAVMSVSSSSTVPNVMMDMMPNMDNNQELPMQMQQKNVGGVTFQPQSDYNGSGMQNFEGINLNTEHPPLYDINAPPFDIEDTMMRRLFFRKVFTILLIQNIIVLPTIVLFVYLLDNSISLMSYSLFSLLCILLFIPMYVMSDYRRYMPMNVLTLAFTTIFLAVEEGIHATYVAMHVAIGSQVVIITQIIVMIIYSKQTRYKFSNVNAFLILIFMYLVVIVTFGMMLPSWLGDIHINIFYVMYYVYDMQLQLTGHHAYNLKPEEAIFSAVNIYADLVNLLWRFFRYIFLDHFLRMFNFFKNCCFAEVC